MQELLDRATYYRLKAEEIRTIAETMKASSSAHDSMMEAAATYERLAEQQERTSQEVRFFFDIRENGTLVQDCHGMVFPTADAVVAEAARAAMDISRDRLVGRDLQPHLPGWDMETFVEVRDESGTRVAKVAVSLKVEQAKDYLMRTEAGKVQG